MTKLHARTEWCPLCTPPTKLTRKNISETHAIKACLTCKRKFRFIRTDTPAGRTERMKAWRGQSAVRNIGQLTLDEISQPDHEIIFGTLPPFDAKTPAGDRSVPKGATDL